MTANFDTDLILPFQIDALNLRGWLVRLGPTYRETLAGHAYPPAVAALMGESLSLTALLATGLKYDGMFTLQIQGDGPVSLVVVQMRSNGDVRGYGRFDGDKVGAAGDDPTLPKLLGTGHLAFTVEQTGGTDRYQGVTDLTGSHLGDCAHAYFRNSEQIETAIKLSGDGTAGVAGLMLQRLPGTAATIDNDEAEENWRHAVALLSSVTEAEMLDPALPAEDLLYRLYHQDGVRVYARRPVRPQCRCSRDAVARTLASFPADEIRDLAEDGAVTVTCEFCKTDYAFPIRDVMDP